MGEWKTYRIEECCDVLDYLRVPLNAETREKIAGNIPYYGANGVQGYIDKYIFNEDLILIAEDGGNFEEFATRPIAYRIYGKSWVNNHAHVLRAKNHFNQDLIFYSLVNKNILTFIVGGTRSKLNQTELRNITVRLPSSKQEQTQIATVLSCLDRGIKHTEALIAKQQRIKAGLLQDLLTKGFDEHGNIRSEATHEFKDSPLGRIPKEWEAVTIDKVGSVRLGRQRSPKHQTGRFTTPYLRVANVFDGWIDYSDVLAMDFTPNEKDIYGLLPNDILLNEGQSLELVGRSAIYEGEANQFCFQNTLVRFRAFKSNHSGYCQLVFKYWLDTGRFIDVARQTTSVAHLGADRFAQMYFPRSSFEEQQRIYLVLNAKGNVIETQKSHLQNLHRIKTGLIQDLLTG